jgi:hypothetical protein
MLAGNAGRLTQSLQKAACRKSLKLRRQTPCAETVFALLEEQQAGFSLQELCLRALTGTSL